MVISHLLNRTLIIPPIRFAKNALSYFEFDTLQRILAISAPEAEDCDLLDESDQWACHKYREHSNVGWSWLVDLQSAVRNLNLTVVERWDMSVDWFRNVLHLNLDASDSFFLRDTSLYEFAFVDADPPAESYKKYINTIALEDLDDLTSSRRLVHLGSVFGTTRLILRKPESRRARRIARESMVLANPHLQSSAERIRKQLGEGYIGVHLRIGDGLFSAAAPENARNIWWKVVCGIMELDPQEALRMERLIPGAIDGSEPRLPDDLSDIITSTIPKPANSAKPLHLPTLAILPNSSSLHCRAPLHPPPFDILNTPIFLSTDAPSPNTHPLIQRFLLSFPCVFFLSDFETPFHIVNGDDGKDMNHYLMGFLDAMVASLGARVVGTKNSTFSAYIQDVLWRKYHGWPITSRG
ncbi:hypothetical protein SISNIDRAFT_457354 [Sistotremastrum niveocremeum HHB9708]|uniref:CigA protein n=2 Tax=Sistotremastraceae TaxID=3402574 RepID=A0A164RP35_9AGAM|nr:hypothetical protein SISNIDRAFT_457354 [Sistotremastrum niveocremeum HHB9708]KZT38084.1 hypothetical protein SISSUDRAFT_1047561 [Sistotremastrum suecicum HHB10207 ss-3]